jgi:MYXO-CTERM domain-containing protein
VSADDTNSSCRVQLAEVGILCPTSAAPAAGAASLLSLAVALGALGALLQRRSQKRRAND